MTSLCKRPSLIFWLMNSKLPYGRLLRTIRYMYIMYIKNQM